MQQHTDYPFSTFCFEAMRSRLVAQAALYGVAIEVYTRKGGGWLLSMPNRVEPFFTEYEAACMIEKIFAKD